MNKRKIVYLVLIFLLLIVAVFAFHTMQENDEWVYKNPAIYGCVPDSETATKIAEAIWQPIYGRQIQSYRPFVAELKDSVWYVRGDNHADFGGVIHIQILKKDCRVLKIHHEK